jgi:hypothetical protein
MRRLLALAAFLVLPACAARLENAAPVAIQQSVKSRDAVADCLLNRLSGSARRPERHDSPGKTTLRFTSLDQWTSPGLYLFTISDAGTGSLVEARMPRGFVARGLPTAETCF